MQCVRTVIIASAVYAVIIATGYIIGIRTTWYPSLIFDFLQTIKTYAILWVPFVWFVMILFIIYRYWSRTISYIEDITTASMALVQPDDADIRLPVELREIEYRMNQIKKTALKNEREAREAEQRKNDLIVYLAHDLKTPLTSVIGYLSLLEEASDMPQEQKAKYIGITLEKAYRLEQLINEFFEITRFNLHSIVLSQGKINLTFMLQQMADEFYPVLTPQGKQVAVHAPKDLMLWGDADKLARVFNNILKNAIAYSDENSTIDISAIPKEDSVVITFTNQGNPIPTQKLNSIFEKFYRLDSARSTNTGGAGLGLAIAKEIVLAHGGTITAQSSKEHTVFTVTLPVSDTEVRKS